MYSNTANATATPEYRPETPIDTVNICLKGIEGPSRKSLVFLLSNQRNTTYKIVDDHPDAITIIDIDDYRGKAAWNRIVNSGIHGNTANVIVLGRTPVTVENGVMLQKPFRPAQLLDAIYMLLPECQDEKKLALEHAKSPGWSSSPAGGRQPSRAAQEPSHSPQRKGLSRAAAASLNEREMHAFLGTTPDVDMDNVRAIEKIQYEPGNFLAPKMQALIKQATKNNRILRVQCIDAAFYIVPQQQCVRTLVKEKSLRAFGALPLGHRSLELKAVSKLPAKVEALGYRYSYEDFIWRLALASSRGRLPKHVNLDQRHQLRRWPNLTRLLLFPHATQISALWIASPKSIREVVNQLGIPQRYVFGFFASASMMGYLQPVGEVHAAPMPTNTRSRHRSLFRRLLDNLSRKHELART